MLVIIRRKKKQHLMALPFSRNITENAYETIGQLFKFLLRWFGNFKCKIILFSLSVECRLQIRPLMVVMCRHIVDNMFVVEIDSKLNLSYSNL